MSFTGYLTQNWGLLIVVFGISIVLLSDIHLEKRMLHQIALSNMLLLLYSVTNYIEAYLGTLENYSIYRAVLSATNYSLISLVLLIVITIMYPSHLLIIAIPAAVNTVTCFVSIPTGIVFRFNDDNTFQRGPIGYLPYIVNGLYLLYLFFRIFRNRKQEQSNMLLLGYMALTSVACFIMPLYLYYQSEHWFTITIAIDLALYYIYLLQRFTMMDPLTKLLNRQCYYSDSETYAENISAIIAMDMDGLKKLNDNQGHTAGDKGLKALAECFIGAAQHKQRVYRIGGDEFVILCVDCTEQQVQALIKRIRTEVDKIPYSCSVGYAMKNGNESIDTLYRRADAELYEEKREYYRLSQELEEKK
ncbi:MAG: GGDEF domain-containing protein [Ruminococcus sp.]|nr:GGDEF domain-containing protein [Ruminococcus sp.]